MAYQIAVLTISYNSLELLKKAVASIQKQSFTNWIHIIVNDGSMDDTADYLDELAQTSDQYIVKNLSQNGGIANARNHCLELIPSGVEYVCILDADDLAREDRLEKQLAFLAKHSELGVLGSNCVFIDDSGQQIGERAYPESPANIEKSKLIENPFANSCVMYRWNIARNLRYSLEFPPCEDYDYWLSLLAKTKGANLPESLVYYRISDKQAVARNVRKMLRLTVKIKLKHIFKSKDFSLIYLYRIAIELGLLMIPSKLVLKLARARQLRKKLV